MLCFWNQGNNGISTMSDNSGNNAWTRIDPAEAGFDAAKLAEFEEFSRNNSGVTSMVVAVDGKIMYTYGDISATSIIASCRKSVLSMLYGKYVADGTIKLDRTVGELGITDIGGLLPSEKLATVYDLLTSRSGVYHPSATSGGKTDGLERGITPHGTRFVYNNWDFNVAGTVFTMLTCRDIFKAFYEELAVPLGLEDYDPSPEIHKLTGNAELSNHLGYHFYLSARDMAKLGELMRLNGVWNGKVLVPADWIERSTKVVSPFVPPDPEAEFWSGYGAMWWIVNSEKHPELKGAYSALGSYGQYIMIIPELKMVFAFKSAGNKANPTKRRPFFSLLYKLLETRNNI